MIAGPAWWLALRPVALAIAAVRWSVAPLTALAEAQLVVPRMVVGVGSMALVVCLCGKFEGVVPRSRRSPNIAGSDLVSVYPGTPHWLANGDRDAGVELIPFVI